MLALALLHTLGACAVALLLALIMELAQELALTETQALAHALL